MLINILGPKGKGKECRSGDELCERYVVTKFYVRLRRYENY